MYKEVRNSRQVSEVLATLLVGVVAALTWQVGVAPWATALVSVAFVCGALGCLVAPDYELVVDESGLGWGRAGRPKEIWILWSDVRVIRHTASDRQLQISVSASKSWSVPTFFLRSKSRNAQFFDAITRCSPDTAVLRA